MSIHTTTSLGERTFGKSSQNIHQLNPGQGHTDAPTRKTSHGSPESLAFTVADDASNEAVVGTIPTPNEAATVSIESGNEAAIFTVSNAGVLSIADNSNLSVDLSPVSLMLTVTVIVGGKEVVSTVPATITIEAA